MPTLPGTVALTTIADNVAIVAVDHRNNYSALQTVANGLINSFNSGISGQVFQGTGTAITPVFPPGYEYSYDTFTSVSGIVATTVGTAITIKTSASVAYDGTAVWVEFFSPLVTNATDTGSVLLELFLDSTDEGVFGEITAGANGLGGPALLKARITPSAASHTFTVKAYVTSSTGVVNGGTFGVGQFVPGYIRVTKA